MNWVDLFIVVILLLYIVQGIRRGFIEQALELIGFFLTIFLSLVLNPPVANFISSHFNIDSIIARPIAFVVLWGILQLIYSIAIQFVYPLIPKGFRTDPLNRF